jgi:PAS domain S-box-containing protein
MSGFFEWVVPDIVRRRYTAKIGLLFVCLILATVGVGYGTTQFVQSEVDQQVSDQYETLSTREAASLRHWHERNAELVRSTTQSASIRRDDRQAIGTYLERQKLTISDKVQHLYYLDLANGTVAASSNREATGRTLASIDAPWTTMFDEEPNGQVTTTDVYRGNDVETPRPLIAYGTRISSNGSTRQALVVTFWPDTYSTQFPKRLQTRTLVVDDQGRVVFDEHPVSFQPYGDSNTSLAAVLSGPSSSGIVQTSPPEILLREQFVDTGQQVYVGYARVPGTDWTVLVHTPTSNAYGFVRRARLAGLGALLVTVVLIGLVGTAIGRQTARELDQLVDNARAIEAGEYDVDCSTDRIDAVGELYDAFETMASTLDERECRLERYAAYTDEVMDALEDVLVIVDATGQIQRYNAQFATVTGYSDAELEEMELIDVFDEADVGQAMNAVEAGFETGSMQAELSIATNTGDTRVFEFVGVTLTDPDGEHMLAAVGRDITERKAREAELERTRELLAQSQQAATVGGFEIEVLDGEPVDITLTDELYRIHGLEVGTQVDPEQLLDHYHTEDRQRLRDVVNETTDTGEPYDIELQLTTAEGEQRRVRAIGEATVESGEIVTIHGAAQDITDRKQYALALESLHDITRGLLHTGTPPAIYELIVDAAENVVDVAGVAAYRLDSEAGTLSPAAFSGGFVDLVGSVQPVRMGSDESPIQTAFLEASPVSLADAGEEFGADVANGICLPIGEYGVFVAIPSSDNLDEQTRKLLETLVATAEAAFDRLESEATIRERDEQLETQNQRLKRQNQLLSMIRTIDQSLIDTSSRDEIETAVCKQLAASDVVSFAWIGSPPNGSDSLRPRAWAGDVEGYLDSVSLVAEGTEPACKTVRTGDMTVISNIVERLREEPWRAEALQRDVQSVISVPIEHEGYTYGVLTAYAEESGAYEDLERRVFAELGETIGNTINAVETQRALYADELTELRLRITEETPLLLQIATELGTRVTFDELASHSDDTSRVFFTVADVDPEAITEMLDALVSIEDHRIISTKENLVQVEATVSEGLLAATLIVHGGTPRSMVAEDGELEVVVDVPRELNVREFVETIQERYPSTTLAGRRTVEQTVETRPELVDSILDELTDRQREVLVTAYLSGFFQWPRENTGEDIAEMLDVSQPTVNRHIRLAQQVLLEQLLEDTNRTPAVPTV